MFLIVCLTAGCATVRGPRDIDDAPPGATAINDWSRVRELESPAEIMLTTRVAGGSTRVFVAADDSRVVVLNLGSSRLTPRSTRALRALAAQHPDAFSPGAAGSFVQDDVRIGRDGVFVANRKVAEFQDIVETIARDDVVAIDGPVVARGSVAGATLGGWLGFAVGVVPGLGGVEAAAAWPIVIASVVAGAYLGHRWSRHTTDGIIYRAP
jgi:hypothetical protein